MALSGGGAEAIGRLLREGGGSSTLLEARVPYDMVAMDEFLGGQPNKYCSGETARLMAMAAFHHAQRFTKDADNIVGIGATASLVKKGGVERAGRRHVVYVAAQTEKETVLRQLDMKANRDRGNEEAMASTLILNTLAKCCGVHENVLMFHPDQGEELIETHESFSGPIQEVVCGRRQACLLTKNGNDIAVDPPVATNESIKIGLGEFIDAVVFPGSFRPLHKNHTEMARLAHRQTGKPVLFEISVKNADKPAIDFISLRRRLDSFKEITNEPWFGGIALTNAPLFVEKAALFPGATFVMGFDTILRISNVKYYADESQLKECIASFHRQGNKFMVFHRVDVDNPVHPLLSDLCSIVDPEQYQDDGTSSTEMRGEAK